MFLPLLSLYGFTSNCNINLNIQVSVCFCKEAGAHFFACLQKKASAAIRLLPGLGRLFYLSFYFIFAYSCLILANSRMTFMAQSAPVLLLLMQRS